MRKNGHDETDSRFSQFCERTHKCVGIIILYVKNYFTQKKLVKNYFVQKANDDGKIPIVLLSSVRKKIQETP